MPKRSFTPVPFALPAVHKPLFNCAWLFGLGLACLALALCLAPQNLRAAETASPALSGADGGRFTPFSLHSSASDIANANDYPTAARAEYVFACMSTNGNSHDALTRCSCSIDAIAMILPWSDYVAGETVLRMRQGGGERATLFRGNPTNMAILAELRRAQAEAEILCF